MMQNQVYTMQKHMLKPCHCDATMAECDAKQAIVMF